MNLRWMVTACFFLGAVAFVQPVQANELDDFQQARSAYDAQDYSQAVALFNNLVGGIEPRLRNKLLILESRKYLAASYLFLGKHKEAEKEFERLLREDPSYQLDPLSFPEEVQSTFSSVSKRLEKERREAERAQLLAEQEARRLEADKVLRERQNLLRLVELAETERVEQVNSRLVAMIPFGIGQFQNDHPNAGIFFAVSEGVLVALSIATFFVHQQLDGMQPENNEIEKAELTEETLRYTNQISLGVLVVLMATGIIDAQVRFNPKKSFRRKREIPSDIRQSFEVSASGKGPLMRLGF